MSLFVVRDILELDFNSCRCASTFSYQGTNFVVPPSTAFRVLLRQDELKQRLHDHVQRLQYLVHRALCSSRG